MIVIVFSRAALSRALQPGFPSTHSANAFVSGLVVAKHGLGAGWLTPTSAGMLVLLHTSHVVFSRLYMGVHSLCDVTGGLFIGVGVGGTVWVLGDQLDALFITPILGLVRCPPTILNRFLGWQCVLV